MQKELYLLSISIPLDRRDTLRSLLRFFFFFYPISLAYKSFQTHRVVAGWMDSNTRESPDINMHPLFPLSPLYHVCRQCVDSLILGRN